MTLGGIMESRSKLAALLLVIVGLAGPGARIVSAQSARDRYTRALAEERTLRDAASKPSLRDLRRAIAAYQSIVRRYPASAYCDNALWQAANLSLLAYERFEDVLDRRAALAFLTRMKKEYPSSSLNARADEVAKQLEPPIGVASTGPSTRANADARSGSSRSPAIVQAALDGSLVTIRDIRRTPLPGGTRVTIEMDGESLFHHERLDNPPRLFFDLKGTRAVGPLQDTTIKFTDGIVKQIRLGRRPPNTTRVVMDIEAIESFSVFTLYNPFRLIVDFTPAGTPPGVMATTGLSTPVPPAAPVARDLKLDVRPLPVSEVPVSPRPKETAPAVAVPPIPTAPSLNLNGQFSLARQLGLGISRIVIDAGHGGHDPGARANGLAEAELVMDVAGRLRKLLERQPGIEVAMTRETDVFVPLEQRTAIANREGADLFLSIHANASRNAKARGVETYFLNFASNPEAEAVAARENSTSGRTMHSLPEIVRAIALNNKLDESRDFADMVQKSMVRKLGNRNGQLRDLGVKQAPFVVLIGAGMPSVLAEISFLTNKQDAQLLKTMAYRQQIAEALFDAVLKYQGSLKKMKAVASRE